MRKFLITLILISFALIAQAKISCADYLVGSGDTLEFSVAGAPMLDRKAVVDQDGKISLPLVGQLAARGKSINTLQEEVKKILPTKTLNIRTIDGRDMISIVSADEISLNIFSYQPLFVVGDVSKAGEQPFKPGLTVIQAIGMAGGYDNANIRVDNSAFAAADLTADSLDLWRQYAASSVQIVRIKAELSSKQDFKYENNEKIPLSQSDITEIVQLEKNKMQESRAQLDNDKSFQARTVAQSEGLYANLMDKSKKDQEGSEIDASETSRLSDLNQRGVVPVTRLVDQRRLSLLSASSFLETIARAQQVLRDRDTAQRNLKKIDEDKRLQLLKDLQEASANIFRLRTRLQASNEKLILASSSRSGLINASGVNHKLVLNRIVNGTLKKIQVGENELVLPGDVIEVEL